MKKARKAARNSTVKGYRLDSIKLNDTYYTEEGYLVDHPIVTTCGVFEYANTDGSIRKELRLPKHVFSPESLASYEGKPIIVTHDAGEIDKSNVREEQIGTILSKGYKDGDNVRCKIVIHDTDALKIYGLRELSLGYSLNSIDEPGVWNGQKYDCIQTDIEINHLALVSEARAGDAARLNIDSKETKKPVYLKGGPVMRKTRKTARNKRYDGDLTPEELEQAIALFKAQNASQGNVDEETENMDADDIIEGVKERKDRRDSDEEALDADEVIAEQEADIEALLSVIDELQAASDMTADEDDTATDEDDVATDEDDTAQDEDDTATDEDDTNCDEEDINSDEEDKPVNMDSVDRLVKKNMRDYLDMCRVADRLNLDGIENMSLSAGRKRIIKAVKPRLNLDGKSDSYIKAAYDIAKQEVKVKKADAQRSAMINKGTNFDSTTDGKSGAHIAREKMISKLQKGGK